MQQQRFSDVVLVCRVSPSVDLLLMSSASYTSALQTIALFGLKLHRFPAMVGAVVFFVL